MVPELVKKCLFQIVTVTAKFAIGRVAVELNVLLNANYRAISRAISTAIFASQAALLSI